MISQRELKKLTKKYKVHETIVAREFVLAYLEKNI